MSLAEAWRSADDVAEDDERFMRAALEQAKRAACEGEVPIGAVVVCRWGYRRGAQSSGSRRRPFGACGVFRHHAGVARARTLASSRLHGVCHARAVHCARALMHQARIGRCVYGAPDAKAGALGRCIRYTPMNGSTIRSRFSRACLRVNAPPCFRNSSKRDAARNRKAMT